MSEEGWRILDVFCGCGGASLGLRNAFDGQCEIVGLDLARDALTTYQFNKVGLPIRCDARRLPLREHADFDLIVACPPCPAFSSAATRRSKSHETEKMLVLVAAEVISLYLPRAFFFENVPGIFRKQFKPLMKRFFNILGVRFDEPEWDRIGREILNPRNKSEVGFESRATRPMRGTYCISWGVIDACNYGVPQTRKRLIVMGALDAPRYEILGEWGEGDYDVLEVLVDGVTAMTIGRGD